MSSLEIAEITGKRHDNIIRDIKSMLAELNGTVTGLPLKFEGYYVASNGKRNTLFNLPKRETLILVSGYSVELRARIVDRWMELPGEIVVPALHDFAVSALGEEHTFRCTGWKNVVN